MNPSRRVVLSLLVTATLLFVGVLFWPFLVNSILKPTALAVWLLLRILVLSIHQRYFWYAVIFAAVLVLFRFLRQTQPGPPSNPNLETSTTMINIGYWRGLFLYNGQNVEEDKTLKRQLISLLTSLYALKQGAASDFHIRDALQQGTLPLPEKIHTFLFPQEPPISGGLLTRFFQSLRTVPRTWIHRWTGQEKMEHDQMIEEVLKFMETSLEIQYDAGKHSQHTH